MIIIYGAKMLGAVSEPQPSHRILGKGPLLSTKNRHDPEPALSTPESSQTVPSSNAVHGPQALSCAGASGVIEAT